MRQWSSRVSPLRSSAKDLRWPFRGGSCFAAKALGVVACVAPVVVDEEAAAGRRPVAGGGGVPCRPPRPGWGLPAAARGAAAALVGAALRLLGGCSPPSPPAGGSARAGRGLCAFFACGRGARGARSGENERY